LRGETPAREVVRLNGEASLFDPEAAATVPPTAIKKNHASTSNDNIGP
jgi:hypothetical protein